MTTQQINSFAQEMQGLTKEQLIAKLISLTEVNEGLLSFASYQQGQLNKPHKAYIISSEVTTVQNITKNNINQ